MAEPSTDMPSKLTLPLPWQVPQWQQLSRALQNKSLSHAYLLCGSEGLGKSLFIQDFAQYALCLNPKPLSDQTESSGLLNSACLECANCRKVAVGSHPDIIQIGVEEGSKNIKIDQIRWLAEFVIRSSHAGGLKIAIIEQAHLLNTNAANALLKTLEEPNDNTHLFLVSDHPGRLVATLRSRCQKLAFSTPSAAVAVPWLQGYTGGASAQVLLDAADGRPLAALRFAEGDSLETRSQLLQSLCEIKHGRRSIQQTVALAAKIGESEVLQHFSQALSKLTKYSLTGIEASEGDPDLESMYRLINPQEKFEVSPATANRLMRFFVDVETSRRQLASTANPNPQLIMESLLWRWSNLRLS